MNKAPIKSNLDEYESLFLALGDKTRLKLLSLMANEPVSVGVLVDELGESQPKVSRHLAYLRNSGVVNTRREGKSIYYGIQESEDPDRDKIINFVIRTMSGESPAGLPVIRRSRQTSARAADQQVRKAKAKLTTADEEYELQIEPGAQVGLYEVQEKEDAEIVFIDSERADSELEVFLL